MIPLKEKKLFLFDIDGTIAIGDTLYEGTRELLDHIAAIGGKAFYITNNSTRSSEDYVRKFRTCFRLETSPEQFITSGYLTVRFLLKHFAGKKIFVLGTDSFRNELVRNGLSITQKAEPDLDCILAAYDNELTYEKLTEACKALYISDAPFYATNPDLRCPIDFGFIPDCGAICDMLTAATGKKPRYLGKPDKEVVRLCLDVSGFSPEETLVVGDRLYTDIACGINAGVNTCVVYTGEATPEETAASFYRPDYCFASIKELWEALSLQSLPDNSEADRMGAGVHADCGADLVNR